MNEDHVIEWAWSKTGLRSVYGVSRRELVLFSSVLKGFFKFLFIDKKFKQ